MDTYIKNGDENFWTNISSTVDQIIADLMEDEFQEEFLDNLMEELELIGQEVGKPPPQPTLSSSLPTPSTLWKRPPLPSTFKTGVRVCTRWPSGEMQARYDVLLERWKESHSRTLTMYVALHLLPTPQVETHSRTLTMYQHRRWMMMPME